MPQFSILETQILAASDNKEIFIEKFEEMQLIAFPAQRPPSSLSHVQNGEQNGEKSNKLKYIDLTSGRKNVMINRDTHEFESRVVYNGIPIPVKIPVAILPETVGDVGYNQILQP